MCHGQLLNDALRQARKEHRCDECGAPIRAGREYRAQSLVSREGFDNVKLCLVCTAAMAEFYDAGECYDPGYLREALKDSANEDGWASLRARLRGAVARLRSSFAARKASAHLSRGVGR